MRRKKRRRTKLEVRKGCIRTSAGALSLSECHVPWVYLWDEAACIARACVCARLPLRSGVRVAGFVLQTGKHPSDLLNVAATVLAL